MTLEKLKEYRQLKKESEQLRESLEKLVENKDKYILHDTVEMSSRITGVKKLSPVIGHDKHYAITYAKRKRAYNERIRKCNKQILEIDKFIANIEKSEIRQIIELRYVRGLSWRATAMRVYDEPNDKRAIMAIQRLFKNN
ncbi:MAG: hypothetical protein FWC13_05290 [Oscillospiraceae bacterium]|nr:hypothetical protein [Oscillospiraceae bacterium]